MWNNKGQFNIAETDTTINDGKVDSYHQRILPKDPHTTRKQNTQSYFAKTGFNYKHSDHVTAKVDVNNN